MSKSMTLVLTQEQVEDLLRSPVHDHGEMTKEEERELELELDILLQGQDRNQEQEERKSLYPNHDELMEQPLQQRSLLPSRSSPIVREIFSDEEGSEYSPDTNEYIFRGMGALEEIIKRHEGNVEILLLPNSPIQQHLFWVSRFYSIKKMAVYVPTQLFPVHPTYSNCRGCKARNVELCDGLCKTCDDRCR